VSRNQTFDLRLHYYAPIDTSQVMRPLATVHFIPMASRAYLEKFGVPKGLDDLGDHRFADQSQHLNGQGAWTNWSGDEILRHTVLFTNQSAFLAKCVREGAGIALMPTYMLLAYDNLVPLDLGVCFDAKLFASYHRERSTAQPVKATLRFLRDIVFNASEMPWFAADFRGPAPNWREILQELRHKAPSADC